MSTHDSPFNKNNFHFDINESTLPFTEKNWGKRGKNSGMSNYMLSEYSLTALKPKPLQAVISLIVTYHVFIFTIILGNRSP